MLNNAYWQKPSFSSLSDIYHPTASYDFFNIECSTSQITGNNFPGSSLVWDALQIYT